MFESAANLIRPTATAHAYAGRGLSRYICMKLSLFVVLLAAGVAAGAAHAATAISSVRVWPAPDYTRVTIESALPIAYQMQLLKNPDRVALDLEDVGLTAALQDLSGKVGTDDPYVKAVRVGRFKPGVVRLVFDLKAEAKPEVFTLKPVAEYGNRLVIDIYPAQAIDPLLALLEKKQSTDAQPAPSTPALASTLGPNSAPPPLASPALKAAKTLESASAIVPASIDPRPKPARPAKSDSQRLVIVAIDAGHGGEDPGARGRGGAHEKDVTLAIAQKLKAAIDREPNMRGVLTRDGDYFIPLHHRVEKARKVSADLFVSVHADAFIKPNARGSSVFALSERGATSSAAKWLAKKENDADLIGGVNLDVQDPYLKMTLADLSFTAQINDSLKLARAVLTELGEINTLHKSDVEQAGFAVLKAPDIPSILVETAFISNPEEERKLRSSTYQEQMADAIVAGVRRYFAQNPPLARARVAVK